MRESFAGAAGEPHRGRPGACRKGRCGRLQSPWRGTSCGTSDSVRAVRRRGRGEVCRPRIGVLVAVGGQRAQVALTLAISKPELLILDEPVPALTRWRGGSSCRT
jgi:hypothetical protein